MGFRDSIKISNMNSNEYYKVYDKNGKHISNIDAKNEKNIKDEFLYGVTCFVINENEEVLMEVRANTELTPGKLDLVSGHVNGDESGLQAIIRELHEEVGIQNIYCNKLHKVNELPKPLGFESKGKIRNFFIDFYCLFAESKQITEIQKEEVKSLKWVSMEEAFDMIKSGKTKFPKQENGKANYDQVIENIREKCLNRNLQIDNVNLQEKKVMEK